MTSHTEELHSGPYVRAALLLLAAAADAAGVVEGDHPPPALPAEAFLRVGVDEGLLGSLCREGLLERRPDGYALTEAAAARAGPPPRQQEAPTPAERPCWVKAEGEVRLGALVLRRMPPGSENQEQLLDALQEDGWPAEMDNPFPGPAKQARALLCNTARDLSRVQAGHEGPALEFHVRGGRVGWRLVFQPYKGA